MERAGLPASLVRLWWIGEAPPDPRPLEDLAAHVSRVFERTVRVDTVPERPGDAYDARRRQFSSGRILQWLVGRLPEDGSKVLGVTDVDLFMPVLTFVYGEAQLGGRAAVVSMARLLDERGPRSAVVVARLAKEAVHELGHTFGLLHCETNPCVMSRSSNLVQVDRKGTTLCHDCQVRYRDAVVGGGIEP